ncbi:hypothetical protein BLA50215_07905 [Burkholderia lata]|uniref:type III secretion system inner membrane ring subunit SctD n=1 Tax=Burkholderia lata (strain ATCC 17760 / DSM 23089 / LMG 22485 / NCIMB 9086 / R18194 / 383) TaxID=482957 RepID=UPI001453DB77|nr:type III secretion system inner membrane ring subunit SctD [Burkholderia lata]VWD64745.1 hypothetical protein BLA50215_07905 [Burkholderia lata]
MDANFKLKLLNGPLSGRELHLPPGPFTVGGEDCDLVLPLEGDAVAMLEVSDQAVTLISETRCWVAGRRHPPGLLPAHTMIDLAGLHFVLGSVDVTLVAPATIPRGRTRRIGWALTAAAIGVVGALSWVFYPKVPAPQSAPQDWLSHTLRTAPRLTALWLNDATVILSGRCRDCSQLSAITERLHAAGVRLQQEAVCDDELKRSVHAVLANYGYLEVSVTLDADDRATIDGPVRNDHRFAELAAALDEVPGLCAWQLSNSNADELAALFTQLQAADLLTGLSVVRGERGWVLSGQLEPARQVALLRLLSMWNTEPERRGPLRFLSVASTARAGDYLSSAIAGVGGNASAPFLELANGMRLQPGSPVLQGMRVMAISPAGISLSSGERIAFLPLHQ